MADISTQKLIGYRKTPEYREHVTVIAGIGGGQFVRSDQRRWVETVTFQTTADDESTSHTASPGAHGYTGFREADLGNQQPFRAPHDSYWRRTERWQKEGDWETI